MDLENEVHEYVNKADGRLLKMLKALAESYEEDIDNFSLSEEDYRMIDERRRAHLNGESQSFSWEEVKQNAKNAKK